jgi:hypothetical protein
VFYLAKKIKQPNLDPPEYYLATVHQQSLKLDDTDWLVNDVPIKEKDTILGFVEISFSSEYIFKKKKQLFSKVWRWHCCIVVSGRYWFVVGFMP